MYLKKQVLYFTINYIIIMTTEAKNMNCTFSLISKKYNKTFIHHLDLNKVNYYDFYSNKDLGDFYYGITPLINDSTSFTENKIKSNLVINNIKIRAIFKTPCLLNTIKKGKKKNICSNKKLKS
jgi:hypothetical protein